jgi:putative DNA primase/helicase
VLSKRYPSGAIIVSEAGLIFGARGMSKDSAMNSFAQLNLIWDGGMYSVGRKTSESFTVRGVRLTVGLQVQEATLTDFLAKNGALARGSGFLARFLIARPISTQGQRFYSEPPRNWPCLARFHQRIADILRQEVPIGEDGTLTPRVMTLEPEAKAEWIVFHDATERDLGMEGRFVDVRDVASKAADNVARLAAQFQVIEQGLCDEVTLDSLISACAVVSWHMNEARRILGELSQPVDLADATRLDAWLLEHCKSARTHFVPTREAQRLGPVRDRDRLKVALAVLEELDRVRVGHEGRRKHIKLNPWLLGNVPATVATSATQA